MPRNSIVMKAPVVGDVSFGSSWERRIQTLAMFSCSLYFIIPSIFVMWGITLWCLVGHKSSLLVGSDNPSLLVGLVAIYLGYVFVLDKSPISGTRPTLLRNLRWWNYSCDYLPLLLVKTADLPTSKGECYILGYHPHGIISVGCFGAFATNGTQTLDLTKKKEGEPAGRGFSSLFPGLDRRVITLPQNFQTPFLREYFLFMGACTSAKETFCNILKRPANAVVVVVGGAAESLHAEEGAMDLVLESRKGFCREAILAQAALVPVLGFGENDLYHVLPPSQTMTKIQDMLKKWTGLGMPVFQGRSILFKEVGIMPQRKPVVVVVGAPIPPPSFDTTKGFHPQIDRKTGKAMNDDGQVLIDYHHKYVEALEELYKKHKHAPWNIPGHELRKSLKIIR